MLGSRIVNSKAVRSHFHPLSMEMLEKLYLDIGDYKRVHTPYSKMAANLGFVCM